MSALPPQTPLTTTNPTIGPATPEVEPTHEEIMEVKHSATKKALNDLTTGIAIAIVAAVIFSML